MSVFFQVSSEYSAIRTGIYLMPVTVGILLASWRAGALARRFSPRALLAAGFLIAVVGTVLIILLADARASGWLLAPGLFLAGVGLGTVLAPSVNVVQSSMPERDQGEISGVSRSVSNLGSSLGTAVAGAVLISALIAGMSSLTQASQVLPPASKEQIAVALQRQVSALSDTQVRAALQGQPQEIVDEVVRINAEARDRGSRDGHRRRVWSNETREAVAKPARLSAGPTGCRGITHDSEADCHIKRSIRDTTNQQLLAFRLRPLAP